MKAIFSILVTLAFIPAFAYADNQRIRSRIIFSELKKTDTNKITNKITDQGEILRKSSYDPELATVWDLSSQITNHLENQFKNYSPDCQYELQTTYKDPKIINDNENGFLGIELYSRTCSPNPEKALAAFTLQDKRTTKAGYYSSTQTCITYVNATLKLENRDCEQTYADFFRKIVPMIKANFQLSILNDILYAEKTK